MLIIRFKKSYLVHTLAITLLSILGILSIVYLVNLYLWSLGPFYGFGYRKMSGWTVVGKVFEDGDKAGLRIGDRIIAVNGKPVDCLESIRANVDRTIGSENRFTISRDGQTETVLIIAKRFGLLNAFLLYGISWSIGIAFALIGAFTFFTTPIDDKPWSFFFFCLSAGLVMTFFIHGKFTPYWILRFESVGFCFMPAAILHMCISFPLERKEQDRHPFYKFLPYIFSLVLLIVLTAFSPFLEGSSRLLRIGLVFYILFSILAFVFLLLYRYLTAPFRLAKLKIRVVLLGFCIGILLPLTEPILNLFFNIYLIPNIDLATLPFITVFPLFIGYAIAKHDLFEIDVFIKRTTGYILTTASIISIYFLFIFIANQFLGTIFHNQQLMTLMFILAVVLFFNPLHNKIQVIVDRLFYRKKYDYTEPVKRLLNDLTFSFEQDLIIEKLLKILTEIMFIENIMIFFHYPREESYHPYIFSKKLIRDEKKFVVPAANPLIQILSKERKEISRDNFYEERRLASYQEELLRLFELFHSELIFPFITHERMYGFLSLGKIKSGRPYNMTDIETLRIIANQAAVSLENIHLFKDKVEKEKLEEELKIAGEIQKRMLPDRPPHTRYFYIYPSITPTKEIGGDFYDFVEMPSRGGKETGLIIGDISGHGIPGALLMSAAHTICQTQAMNTREVGQMMGEVNRLLVRETKKKAFVGLIYARLLPDKRITIANAGLPSPLYYNHRKKEVRFIENEGERLPLGISDEPHYSPMSITMDRGDMILFYTDGAVEVRSKDGKEFFSFNRLKDTFAKFAEHEPEEIYTHIVSELKHFSGSTHFEDDMTLIFLKHVESNSFDTTLSLPVASNSANLVSHCAETQAQLYALNQDDIDQFMSFIKNAFHDIADYGKRMLNYKLVIHLFRYKLDDDHPSTKKHIRIIDPMTQIGFKELLKGDRFVNGYFSMELSKKNEVLEKIDTSNISRIIVNFSN